MGTLLVRDGVATLNAWAEGPIMDVGEATHVRSDRECPPGPGHRSVDDGRMTPRCSACKSGDVVPIVWGLPGTATFEEADAGKVHLGGCVVSGASPEWHCHACGNDFRSERAPTPATPAPSR
jgi:hypothetical protein